MEGTLHLKVIRNDAKVQAVYLMDVDTIRTKPSPSVNDDDIPPKTWAGALPPMVSILIVGTFCVLWKRAGAAADSSGSQPM